MGNKNHSLGLIAVLAMLAGFASATTRWTGGSGTTDWTDSANWNSGVPDGSENVYISDNGINGTAVLDTIDSGGTFGVGWYANGTSTLTIAGSGSFSSTANATIGYAATSKGILDIDGGTFSGASSNSLAVGNSGEGELNIRNGGTVLCGTCYIGSAASGVGRISVEGGGSTLVSSGTKIRIGNNGSGALNISNGGSVAVAQLYAGYSSGATGSITVDGSGSTLVSSASPFVLGHNDSSTASLAIGNGGTVDSAGAVFIGNASASAATAEVSGIGSTWRCPGSLRVGRYGVGTLIITEGGLVIVGELTIDENLNADGVVRMNSDGMLAVADGGTTATTLAGFLALVSGTDNIEYWNGAVWENITNATPGIDYVLGAYSDAGTDYTKLTVFGSDLEIGKISVAVDGSDIIASWTGLDGVNFALQSKENLVEDSWSDEVVWIPGVAGTMSTTSSASAVKSFCRLLGFPTAGIMERIGIPAIDLDTDANRQIVVDQEASQYLGQVSTTMLDDDTIYAVYPKGHGNGAIVMKRSEDGGLTWSERLPTPGNWETSRETPTIFRTVDSNGVERLILWSGLYPARMARSEDQGNTWTPLAEAGDWGGIVVMGFVEPLEEDGHYLAMFHDNGAVIDGSGVRSGGRELYQTFSEDGGLTWSQPEMVYSSTNVFLCEPFAIRSPDGNEIAVLLRDSSRRKNSHAIFSSNEGETWSEPRELPLALTGDRHVAKYSPDGRLFISFRANSPKPRRPTRTFETDWVGWVGTYEDIVQGREGQYIVRLKKNHRDTSEFDSYYPGYDCGYSGVELMPDGTFVCTSYGHWIRGEAPFIMCVRFTLDDLDGLAENQGAGE